MRSADGARGQVIEAASVIRSPTLHRRDPLGLPSRGVAQAYASEPFEIDAQAACFTVCNSRVSDW